MTAPGMTLGIAARIDRKNGSAVSASRSSARRVSARYRLNTICRYIVLRPEAVTATALWTMTAWAREGAIGLRHFTSVAVAVELAVRHKHYGARSSAGHCFKFYSTNFN